MLRQLTSTFLLSLALADDSTNATLTGSADGIWTGHDWNSTMFNIGVSNGIPYGMDDATQRKIESP